MNLKEKIFVISILLFFVLGVFLFINKEKEEYSFNYLVSDYLEIEIGDSSNKKVTPHLKINAWDNEVSFSIFPADISKWTEKEPIKTGDKLVWKNEQGEINFYPIAKKEEDRIESSIEFEKSEARYINIGNTNLEDFGAIYNFPKYASSDEAVVTQYYSKEKGFVFYGDRLALRDIDLDNNPFLISRIPTAYSHDCPVFYSNRRYRIINFYYPGIQEKLGGDLEIVEASLNAALDSYSVEIRRSEMFAGHVLYYQDGLNFRRFGRTAFDGDYLQTVIYFDNPLEEELLSYVKPMAKAGILGFPKGGLEDLNPEIGPEIVDDFISEFAKRIGLDLNISELREEEEIVIEKLKEKYSEERFINTGVVEEELLNPNIEGYELEVVFYDKPESNKIDFNIETNNLNFFYQPELTEKEIEYGHIRPENVVGSYAVYHKDKTGDYSRIGGKNYRTGKAFHIYRPWVKDNNGE